MFFKKKAKVETKALLYKENIQVNSDLTDKQSIIKALGQMLVDSGYVNQPYIDGMLERENTFSTYMGEGLVIPHGVEEAKKQVLHSGIAVMTFPNGVAWDDEVAKLAVGIASVGEEHLEILSIISEKIMSPEDTAMLIHGDVDTVYNILMGKD